MENYELKRTNFKLQALKHFAFLVDELKYEEPIFSESIQENGTVISDRLEYKNYKLNRRIRISNQYHPNDYGFEINFSNSTHEPGLRDSKMLAYCLKENQDTAQNYIEKIALSFRKNYEKLTK